MTSDIRCDCGTMNPDSARYGHAHLPWCQLSLNRADPRDAQIATLEAQLAELERERRPGSLFNQVCAALGLFDGARPTSPRDVLLSEVLPAIEALKANNPAAAIFIEELQRVHGLWHDALGKLMNTNRQLETAEAQCAAQQARIAELEKAALELVIQMDHVLASPEYQAALAIGWVHSRTDYRGPNWKAEYDNLRSTLTASPSRSSQP